jgi:hypothetical protein
LRRSTTRTFRTVRGLPDGLRLMARVPKRQPNWVKLGCGSQLP